MSQEAGGNNSLTVTGENNSFVVIYTSEPPTGPALPAEVQSMFGTDDPSASYGTVITVTGGGNSTVVEGGSKQFVVQYVLPTTGEAGGNSVLVEGGGNAFAVVYDPVFGIDGNTVMVHGNDDRFVVAYNHAQSLPTGNSVVVDGGNDAFVVANNVVRSAGNPAAASTPDGADPLAAVFSQGSSNNAGVVVGTPGTDTVRVSGSNNQYVIQYDAPPDLVPAPGEMPSGPTFDPAALFGGSLTDLLAQSPFAPLLGLPGVNADSLFGSAGTMAMPAGLAGLVPVLSMTDLSFAALNPFAALMTDGVPAGLDFTAWAQSQSAKDGVPVILSAGIPGAALPNLAGVSLDGALAMNPLDAVFQPPVNRF